MGISAIEASHLLRRTGFGPRAAEVRALMALDRAAAVNQVLNVTPKAAALPSSIQEYYTKEDEWNVYPAWTQWWLERMATTESPIVEKMSLFWHGHFTSSLDKSKLQTLWEQNQLFRTKGMGSFRELCHQVAIGPAMMDYLDQRVNRKDALNENFARELMEIFTIGVGNYTQADVRASARAWTGHVTKDDNRVDYAFEPASHDSGNKTFMGITKNWNGPDIIDFLCTGDKGLLTAKRLATRLWEFFAYVGPPPALIDTLARRMLANKLNIKLLLRDIFMSDEFWSDRSRYGHVRSPAEWMVAARRHMGVPFSEAEPQWVMAEMGQKFLYPPNVAGWPGDKMWITSGVTWAKGNYARSLAWAKGYEKFLSTTATMTPVEAARTALGAFGVDKAATATVETISSAVAADRTAQGGNERHILIVMSLLSPEFQVA